MSQMLKSSGVTAVAAIAIAVMAGCTDVKHEGRPRTLRDAMISKHGSNRSHPIVTNGAPEFRQYDQAMCDEISKRWYDLLDAMPLENANEGKVIVKFLLHDDGRATDVVILENTTSMVLGLRCEKAILDPQPYPAWPQFMRERVAKDSREITFTFFYK